MLDFVVLVKSAFYLTKAFIISCCLGCPPIHQYKFRNENKVEIKRIDIKQSNTVRINNIIDNRTSWCYSGINNQLIIKGSKAGDRIYLFDNHFIQ